MLASFPIDSISGSAPSDSVTDGFIVTWKTARLRKGAAQPFFQTAQQHSTPPFRNPGPCQHDRISYPLSFELTAINQYFLHFRMYKDWGLGKLADKEHEESVDEMKHADQVISRILFFEGLPNLQDIGKLRIGEDVEEMLQCDIDLELDAVPDLKAAITFCESRKDFVSRDLFNSILKSEEDHVDWLETHFGLIDRMGIENYTQQQS